MPEVNPIHSSQQHKLDQDRLLEIRHRHKWRMGEASPTPGHPSKRPNKPTRPPYFGKDIDFSARKTASNKSQRMGRAANQRLPPCPSTEDGVFDHEDDVTGAITGTEPEAAYTYSFDSKGANKGSQVLGQALEQAVEKYETNVTEKLVKTEYEVVEDEDKDKSTSSSTDEDDYELL